MWRRVSRKYPTINHWVLVCLVDKQSSEPYKHKHFYDRFISIGKWTGTKWIMRDIVIPGTVEVTHWQALPAFPRRDIKDWFLSGLHWLLKETKTKRKLPGRRVKVFDEVR